MLAMKSFRLEKIVIENRSHRVEHSAPNRQIDDCFQPNGEIFHDSFLSMQCVGVQDEPSRHTLKLKSIENAGYEAVDRKG